jgi:hypothetical protein
MVRSALRPPASRRHDPAMSVRISLAFSLIGLGAVAAGVLGLRLPSGDRLAAALALLVGAGVGVIAMAIGSQAVGDTPESSEAAFLVASAFGFVATLASLALLWRWAGSRE